MMPGDIPSFKIYDASNNTYYDTAASEDIPPWIDFGLNQIDNLNVEPDCAGVNGVMPGCDIWPEVPGENMNAMVNATIEFGKIS